MPHAAIEQTVSINRFSTYRRAVLSATGMDCPATALKLYEWNAELASRFFFPIHIYEIALRNAISDAIAMRYGTDWPVHSVFINSLPIQDRQLLNAAIGGNYINVGKLLPELKFVWFENMLTSRHDGRIWTPYIAQVFPNSPSALTTQQLRVDLKNACCVIRKFRNRCGHHEPIFNTPTLHDIYPLIVRSIDWRCPVTRQWLDAKQTVLQQLSLKVI